MLQCTCCHFISFNTRTYTHILFLSLSHSFSFTNTLSIAKVDIETYALSWVEFSFRGNDTRIRCELTCWLTVNDFQLFRHHLFIPLHGRWWALRTHTLIHSALTKRYRTDMRCDSHIHINASTMMIKAKANTTSGRVCVDVCVCVNTMNNESTTKTIDCWLYRVKHTKRTS